MLRTAAYRIGFLLLREAGRVGNVFGFRSDRPVIMVGTGRCGTTLLDNILRTHPGVARFPAERNELWHPALEPFDRARIETPPIEVDPRAFSNLSIQNWPRGHSQTIRDVFSGFHLAFGRSKTFFVKSAMIVFILEDILAIFPRARIVHVYRYGPSVIESLFKMNFGRYSEYDFTEKDYYLVCARYWNSCILEIERVKGLYGLEDTCQFCEFSYETFCEEPGKILDDLAGFMGIDPGGFEFDLSTVRSTNYKVIDSPLDGRLNNLVGEDIRPAMRLKRYL